MTTEVSQQQTASSGPENGSSDRQVVSPRENQYVDQFWSGLYSTLCSFGFAEVRLIWMRFSAFLVAHGVFIGLIGRSSLENPANMRPLILLLLSLIGLILGGLWIAINSLGWMNQNRWYWYAARLKFEGVTIPLPTDRFATPDVPRPFGVIFWVAQIIPSVFVLGYSALLGFAVHSLGYESRCAITASGGAAGVVLVTMWVAHEVFYYKIKRPTRPLCVLPVSVRDI